MIRLLTAIALLAFASGASAQSSSSGPLRATDLVTWTARIVPGEDAGEARFVASATIADGWRLYAAESPSGIPLTLTIGALPTGVSARGGLRQTRPQEKYDEILKESYTYHSGTARVSQGLHVTTRASGRHRVGAEIRFAVCNDSVCLPPTTVPVRATLSVGG
ncbi:protein-disulfide reductase DsbD domain-containing protein [Rubricoccus marinus]|uniref:Thiol:disulfide interchange protein DsbD N-terminal domain-containing protein n=1 Tax=Rubricoccus marinus TaxID=716817 RepID=A0A259TZH8_9BACT|nr:protein-disulfide reductase DsbD domain-containing protein [Rubricoccus marinus]OZC03100.1 hypothetical protein BSZ36_09015 [Rubricoccus marinus]